MQTPSPIVEWIEKPAGRFRAAMFDFDGTLSMLREDWPEIMCGMMVERLLELGTAEPPERLRREVEHFVMQLNGKPTIHQMQRLVDEIARRGGRPRSAEDYKADYWKVLLARAGERMAPTGAAPEDGRWLVPGCRELLQELEERGIALYLVSGSEYAHVCTEADFLQVSRFFVGRIHGPMGDRDGFLKRHVAESILRDEKIAGGELVGFGDGVVETEDIRAVGGYAVGVASRSERDGLLHADKRARLIAAGAQMLIPDYAGRESWFDILFPR